MIRQAHERPEGMDEGTLIMSGLDQNRIIESINVVSDQYNNKIIPKTFLSIFMPWLPNIF